MNDRNHSNPADNRDYAAPIPPFGDADESPQQSSEPRYLRTEPLPPRQGFPGMSFPGMQPGAGGARPGLQPGMPLVLPRKSLLLAVALAAFLGPLGMLYSTFLGAFVMMGVWFWTLLLFSGAFPFVWAWGVVWALWAAHRKNDRRRKMEAYIGQM